MDHVISSVDNHRCEGYANKVGSVKKGCKCIHYHSGHWGCPNCRYILVNEWMAEINKAFRGVVLYTVQTKLQGEDLSSRIRRNIKKKSKYYCAHLYYGGTHYGGALIVTSAPFTGAEAINKGRFMREIEDMMERGKVIGMSRSKKEEPDQKKDPWVFADIADDIVSEYSECKTDYQIGCFLKKYRETGKAYNFTELGAGLLHKIETGEINADTPTNRKRSISRGATEALKNDRKTYSRLMAESEAAGENLSDNSPHSCWGYADPILDRLAAIISEDGLPEEEVRQRIQRMQEAMLPDPGRGSKGGAA